LLAHTSLELPITSSGNPAGRPKGSRNRLTRACADLLAADAPDIMERVIKEAKKRKAVALKLCIERLLPARAAREPGERPGGRRGVAARSVASRSAPSLRCGAMRASAAAAPPITNSLSGAASCGECWVFAAADNEYYVN